MKIINLFAGPGAGKSTTAAGLFHIMKLAHLRAELVTEYAKQMTWEKRDNVLADSLYIFAKQHRRILTLKGMGVDYVVTDSPLLLSAVYLQPGYPAVFEQLVVEFWNGYDNHNFFLERTKPYVKLGRSQDEAGARDVDAKVHQVLERYAVPYTKVPGNETAPARILAAMMALPAATPA